MAVIPLDADVVAFETVYEFGGRFLDYLDIGAPVHVLVSEAATDSRRSCYEHEEEKEASLDHTVLYRA
jgi:hypothetical protein